MLKISQLDHYKSHTDSIKHLESFDDAMVLALISVNLHYCIFAWRKKDTPLSLFVNLLPASITSLPPLIAYTINNNYIHYL